MFTGIVEEKGKVRYIQLTGESGILAVKARKVLEGTKEAFHQDEAYQHHVV